MDSSYGGRPNKNAHQALDAIAGHLQAGYRDVYDADLKGYFDTIPHNQLMKCLDRDRNHLLSAPIRVIRG